VVHFLSTAPLLFPLLEQRQSFMRLGFMKKVISVLVASCVFSMLSSTTASFGNYSSNVVEAGPTLAVVSGTVKDDSGAPVIGAVVALLESKPLGKELKSVKTDTLGRFSATITPGLYRLRAAAAGFVPKITRVSLSRPEHITHNFALKRDDTLVQRRGDSDDYRWIARSVPRHAMNLQESEEDVVDLNSDAAMQSGLAANHKSFHGVAQFVAVSSNGPTGYPNSIFFGTNFAVSGALSNNLEMAFIGQRGTGQLAPQRMAAIATVRPGNNHQVTTTIGYGHIALSRKLGQEPDLMGETMFDGSGTLTLDTRVSGNNPNASLPVAATTPSAGVSVNSLDQISVSTVASWQIFQPLLVIYGFDYSRFLGSTSRQRDSILPRFAVQYSPSSSVNVNAAITPGADTQRQSLEDFDTENIQGSFETSAANIAFAGSPILDRSQRFETGIERLFGEGNSSVQASAFYDMISGHGVGVLALPLEASPETQMAFQQVAHHVTAMNGAARGVRLMYHRRLNEYASASVGYSFGRGERFNNVMLETMTPAQLFRGGFFQVAAAKMDLDFTHKTGTRISTVIRLSPSAVIFAIDPFAGQMSVYDPNINIYVTQELPNLGLPGRWQAIVDIRNLLDQATGVDDGSVQIVASGVRRSVRGGLAFRW